MKFPTLFCLTAAALAHPIAQACGRRACFPAFQPGDHGLGRLHTVRYLFLGQAGTGARLDSGLPQGAFEMLYVRIAYPFETMLPSSTIR